MSAFSRPHLESLGFEGFAPLRSLPAGCPAIPKRSGAYAVLRESSAAPRFLKISVGGHFKGEDPTVSLDRLRAKWVDGAETVYLGRSGNLRRRLDEFALFGRGEAIGHRGGRYLWQLADHDSLLVGWFLDENAAGREAELIGEFILQFGSLPFANINRPRTRQSR